MKNVIAYIQVSTDGQCGEDNFGLEMQREQIEDYCRRNDMNIMKWYVDEGETGTKYREKFDEIVYSAEISNPPVEAVVVAKSDRVASDINIYFYYQGSLLRKGIELISITEDFGQLGVFANMLHAFTLTCAEMERDSITKRTMAGRNVKGARGGHAAGSRPYGYQAVNGKLIVDEKEAESIRQIFGMRKNGATMKEIADTMNRQGITTKKGGAFATSTIQVILDNENLYRGFYRYGKENEWVKGEQEAILKYGE